MKNSIVSDYKSSISQSELSAFALNVLTRLKNNPAFASIKTPLVDTELQNATDRYVLACQEATDRSILKMAAKRARKAELVSLLEKTAAQVNAIALGDEMTVLDSGFHIRRAPVRSDKELEPVTGLRAQTSTGSDKVSLTYKTSPSALAHIVEMSTDDKVWITVGNSTSSAAVITGVPLRQEVLLRVFTIGSNQRKSPPSEAIRVYLM